MTDNEAFSLLAQMVADHVIAKLRDQLTFPTAEDIERIRDHVSPNGIAWKNGYNAAIDDAVAEIDCKVTGNMSVLYIAQTVDALKKP